jgi:hypothetical protein
MAPKSLAEKKPKKRDKWLRSRPVPVVLGPMRDDPANQITGTVPDNADPSVLTGSGVGQARGISMATASSGGPPPMAMYLLGAGFWEGLARGHLGLTHVFSSP